jgi:hypothetical protein
MSPRSADTAGTGAGASGIDGAGPAGDEQPFGNVASEPAEAMPAPASAPVAATPAIDAAPSPPEKTGVIFDWPETDPSASRNCMPGRYVGEFSCRLFIVVSDGDGAFDVSGTIDMQLEQTADGELLRIAGGRFESATLAAIPMSADVVGELDCSTSRFEGRLENGVFSVALGLPIPFTEGTFSGPLGSEYDPATATLTGTWDMMGELDGIPGTCMNGNWSAQRVQ